MWRTRSISFDREFLVIWEGLGVEHGVGSQSEVHCHLSLWERSDRRAGRGFAGWALVSHSISSPFFCPPIFLPHSGKGRKMEGRKMGRKKKVVESIPTNARRR